MGYRYEVKSSISRHKARELLTLLREDDAFRDEFTRNPRKILFEYRIDLSPDSLPETVSLPSKEAIGSLLDLGESIVEESASPFGFLLLFVVFGAMPMVEGAVPAGDGTG
jgi:hypothetical protein